MSDDKPVVGGPVPLYVPDPRRVVREINGFPDTNPDDSATYCTVWHCVERPFLAQGLFIWGASDTAIVENLVAGDRRAAIRHVPAKLFEERRSFAELQELLEAGELEEDVPEATRFDCETVRPGSSLALSIRGRFARAAVFGIAIAHLNGCSNDFTSEGDRGASMGGATAPGGAPGRPMGKGGAEDVEEPEPMGGRPEPATGGVPGSGGSGTGGAAAPAFPDPSECVTVVPGVPVEMTDPAECYAGDFDLLFCSFCEGARLNGEPREISDLDAPAPWVLEVESECFLNCVEAGDSCAWNGTDWDC